MTRARTALLASLLLASPAAAAEAAKAPPTPAEALSFLDAAEKKLLALGVEAGRAGWVQANFITEDTEALSALASERLGSRDPTES